MQGLNKTRRHQTIQPQEELEQNILHAEFFFVIGGVRAVEGEGGQDEEASAALEDKARVFLLGVYGFGHFFLWHDA